MPLHNQVHVLLLLFKVDRSFLQVELFGPTQFHDILAQTLRQLSEDFTPLVEVHVDLLFGDAEHVWLRTLLFPHATLNHLGTGFV